MYGWTGTKVRLVPLDKERHLENALRWFNDPEITRHTLVGVLPLGRLAEEEYFLQAARLGAPGAVAQATDIPFAIETLEQVHVGFTGIMRIEWLHRVALTGSLIGRSDLWNLGYGSDAARLRSRYAFDVLGLRLLLADVFADNVASQKMLQRVGYREVGRIPERYWVRGRTCDSVLLALDRGAFERAARAVTAT